MKIQAPRRIIAEDFPQEDQNAAHQLGGILNNYNEELYSLVSQNITISDNLNQEIKSITVNVNILGNPNNPIKFKNNLKGKIQGMNVIRTFGEQYVIYHPFIDFSESGGIVTINNIKGLVPDMDYTFVIHIIGN